jgi:enoyl-CoA hydratase/carnithine racemase
MADEQIITEKHGRVGIIRLNRPDRLNALSEEMLTGLYDAVEAFNQDRGIGAIVFTGEGRAFSAGGDVGRWQEEMDTPGVEDESKPNTLLDPEVGWVSVAQRAKPIIAAVNGIAVGAGVTMLLSCDARIASEQARFSLRFVRMGLLPELASSRLLVHLIGLGPALELILSARTIDAREAERIGLVSRVVPHDKLVEAAVALGEEVAYNPTSALLLAKQLVWSNLFEPDLRQVILRENDLFAVAKTRPAFKEAVQAFMEKREPRFDQV